MFMTERISDSQPECVPFADVVIGVYPKDPRVTGHSPDIMMPGLYAVTDFPKETSVLTSENSEDVRKLQTVLNEEIVLARLVPREYVDNSIIMMAEALGDTISDPENTVFSPIQKGGEWLFNRLQSLLPQIMVHRHDIEIKRTDKGQLIEPEMEIGFDKTVKGKDVWIVEDLGDKNKTLARAAQDAREHGAKSVHIAMLVNKLGVADKQVLPELSIVGLGIPDIWVGGAGADITDDFCREYPDIWAKIAYSDWLNMRYSK